MSEINLTKEQENCVNFSGGDLLVKGVAGSGKSCVILSRAKKTMEKNKGAKIIIFTFQNTLVKYTKEIMKRQLGDSKILVSTVDSYCRDLYLRACRLPRFTSIQRLDKNFVTGVLEKYQKKNKIEHRLLEKEVSFWIDEFDWIRGKCITTKEEYLTAERKGRGSEVRVLAKDREFIWDIYQLLLVEMKKSRFIDWNEIYLYLNEHPEMISADQKFDYVFLDEAQDMTFGKMKVIKYLTTKTLTIAADVAQKIHKSTFTWKEVGIDISGRASKTLSKSFRSTKEIVMLAEDLMKENRRLAGTDDDYTEAVFPEVSGPIPQLYKCKTIYSQNGYVLGFLKRTNLKEKRVGIIVYSETELRTYTRMFFKEKIEYQYLDGAKDDWDVLSPGVKLVKAHSSKGLEFDYVVIPYLVEGVFPYKPNWIEEDALEEYLKIQRSILYVAMTRARTALVLLTIVGSESRFIDAFDKAHYKEIRE